MGAVSLAVLAVACAGAEQRQAAAGYDSDKASRLFSVGYHDIADIYIEDIEISELALAGLSGLEQVDPSFRLTQHDGLIEVMVDGRSAGAFEMPGARNSEAWGDLTADVLAASLRRSDEIGAAEVEGLYKEVFESLLDRLDPYSRYAGAERARDNRANRDGFGGIGATVEATQSGIRVLEVRNEGPAARAGLKRRDLIVQVNGAATEGLEQRDAIDLLRGRIDTAVEIIVRRPDVDAHIGLTARRAHIVPETVAYHREGDAAYIKVSGFNQDTANSVERTLERAKDEIGPSLTGFILDLRGNPGGLLDQAVDVSDIFVTDGRIVSTHGRHPDSHQYFSARRDDHGDGRPVVVLVDRGSASAAEIVAAAIQDSGRGLIVGSGSYGKGTVQTVLRLPNKGELTLTWARFHAPSGYALSKRGVLPDVCTSRISGSADAVTNAIRDGLKPIDTALRTLDVASDDVQAVADLRRQCPPRNGDDAIDIEVARRLLHDPSLFRMAGGKPAATLAKVDH